MGVEERKQREREQRKQDIIDAAETVFARYGFENSTMDNVADEAEFSKGTLYLYFKNKQEICMAIISRSMDALLGEINSGWNDWVGKSGFELLAELKNIYCVFRAERPDYCRALLKFNYHGNCGEESGMAGAVVCKRAEVISMITAVVEQGITDGSVRQDMNPEALAETLFLGCLCGDNGRAGSELLFPVLLDGIRKCRDNACIVSI
ncbi:MAG: TetR/AcrR family transcriptional regulator [Victivallaceae bacterium]|nr:TetR/AcrR family transcriptional regulator [Victivallaceae bacterium]